MGGKIEIRFKKLFINNEFVDSVSGKTFSTINPTNGQIIAEIASADEADVDNAVKAAKGAFARTSVWRQMDASARGRLIHHLANLIERDTEYLAKLETLDNGKPLAEALFDIECTIDTFRYYAGFCDKIHGKTIPSDGNFLTLTRKEPIGIVGQIIPWNYPLLMLAWKWGPALAAGCPLILKPAEQTPLTALAVAALAKEAGFPPGVINVLPGYGPTAGAAIAQHHDINKIAFTGSCEIGAKIMEYSAKSNLKKVSLELGGKSPLIVCNDVDLDEAVMIAHNAIFANHGQNCCAGSRTYVQSGIYEQFVRKAAEKAAKRRVGDPFQNEIEQGPQIDKVSLDKILRLIEMGKEQGATLLTGGAQIGSEGFFVQPTVFANVKDNMTIAKEEIFGPVQCILQFDTIEEVIERANNTKYGLASGILTKNLDTALTFAQAIQAGSVWVNCYDAVVPQAPFGGYKMSGIGRELGADSLEEYLETKTITIKVPTKA